MKSTLTDVSVIIPTYNRRHFVVEALESVLRQTRPPQEVVVVDDGSIDDTGEVLRAYRDRIRYVHQENGGEAVARNRGVRESSGTWVAFLDSDDLWEPHTLETLLRAAEQHPEAGLVAMRGRAIAPDGRRTSRTMGKKTRGPYFRTEDLLGIDAGGVQMPMVRRGLLEQVGGFDETLRSAPDVDMWIRLSFHTRLLGVPEVLLLRRLHAENLSGDKALNARMWLRILDKLAREHPDFVRTRPWVYRRALGKERLRLGRELLARVAADPGQLSEARHFLRRSIGAFPFVLRAYLYLVWSLLAPASYGAWRRRERQWRGRMIAA